MLLTSTRRCRGVVALEPLPEVARALKRSLQMNGWEEKSQVRPGVLSSKCCVKIWKTWKLRMKFGWDTTNILINKRPPKIIPRCFFWFSSYMKIRISSRWMLLLLHQLTWSQVIQAFAGAQSGWGRMHFLGHADGNPYASASVPWQ